MIVRISELVAQLEVLRETHGDLPVVWESITHNWPPDPVVRENARGEKRVVING